MQDLNKTIKTDLRTRLKKLENYFKGDVAFLYGPIFPALTKPFRDFMEKMSAGVSQRELLVLFLNTPGGDAETVEKLVEIIRFHYKHVNFIVPDYALSAGTIFCMSGDKIFMDYSSALGPIDPQVFNGKEWVPALGYLDQVERLLEKAKNKTLTEAEFLILQNQDLATLSRYEQARNLTITLLKKWLVEQKFKDWTTHETDQSKKDKPVTKAEKEQRAEQIAVILGDNKKWHSHGRRIGIRTLSEECRLKIEDYSKNLDLRRMIRSYNDLLTEFIAQNKLQSFLHSKDYF
jgi:hypothetical protein